MKMHSRMAAKETATVPTLNQKDSFTPKTMTAVRIITAARAMGSITTAELTSSQAATQNLRLPDGWPAIHEWVGAGWESRRELLCSRRFVKVASGVWQEVWNTRQHMVAQWLLQRPAAGAFQQVFLHSFF